MAVVGRAVSYRRASSLGTRVQRSASRCLPLQPKGLWKRDVDGNVMWKRVSVPECSAGGGEAVSSPVARLTLEEVGMDTWEEKVMKASGLVVVDCYTDWCGPCKLMLPKLEEMAAEYADCGRDIKLVKLNCNKENKPIAKDLLQVDDLRAKIEKHG